jgi:hypothetical protein
LQTLLAAKRASSCIDVGKDDTVGTRLAADVRWTYRRTLPTGKIRNEEMAFTEIISRSKRGLSKVDRSEWYQFQYLHCMFGSFEI